MSIVVVEGLSLTISFQTHPFYVARLNQVAIFSGTAELCLNQVA
jgi:hypothetical protein